MSYRFPAPCCRFLGWGNPGAAGSWQKVNTESMESGKLLSFNFSFSQCIYLLISKREVFWRNGRASPWHPTAVGGIDCSCWSQLQLLVPIRETSRMPPVCLFWTAGECIKSASLIPRLWKVHSQVLTMGQAAVVPSRQNHPEFCFPPRNTSSLWSYLRNYI